MRARHGNHKLGKVTERVIVDGISTAKLTPDEVKRFKDGVANPVERFGNPWPLDEKKPA
jgi:hypothetical protein